MNFDRDFSAGRMVNSEIFGETSSTSLSLFGSEFVPAETAEECVSNLVTRRVCRCHSGDFGSFRFDPIDRSVSFLFCVDPRVGINSLVILASTKSRKDRLFS